MSRPSTPALRPSALRRTIAATSLLLGAGGLLTAISAPGFAGAATISAITGASIQQATSGAYEWMRVDLTYSVPADAHAGDTFTFILPPELKSLTNGFDLRDAAGNLVAVAVVAGDVVTFTLTNFVDSHVNVSGTAFFQAEWDRTKITPGEKVDLEFTVEGTTYRDTVDITDVGLVDRSHGYKYQGWTNRDLEDHGDVVDALQWGIDSPRSPADAADSTVTIVDTPGTGSALDCASIWAFETSTVDAFHELTNLTYIASSRVVVTCTPAGATVVVTGVGPNTWVRVAGKSTVTTTGLDSYTNSGSASLSGQTDPVSAVAVRASSGGNGSGSVTTTTTTTTPSTSTTSTTSTSAASTTTTTTTAAPSSSTTSAATASTTTLVKSWTAAPVVEGSQQQRIASSYVYTPSSLAVTGGHARVLAAVSALLVAVGALLLMRSPRSPRRR